MGTNIFLKIRKKRLDSPVNKPPDGQITKFVGWVEPRETHHLHKMQLMGIAEFIIEQRRLFAAASAPPSGRLLWNDQRSGRLCPCARSPPAPLCVNGRGALAPGTPVVALGREACAPWSGQKTPCSVLQILALTTTPKAPRPPPQTAPALKLFSPNLFQLFFPI